MKKLILLITILIFASCTSNLEDLNQNIKDPSAVPGESLFTGAQKNLVDQMVDLNVNNNNTKLWAQYLQETTYTNESNYDQVGRSIPGRHWSILYKDVLKDLDEASKVITATDYALPEDQATKANKLVVIEILNVYTYSVLVETYGNVPYTEALDIDNLLPAYDDGLTIYKDLISRLSIAISSLDTANGSFGAADRIYDGDTSNWKLFANSLKLRMGILLSDVDNVLAKQTVESAVADGVFSSSVDNANYTYLSADPNTNPIHANLVLSGRHDYVAAVTVTDMMNTLEDPRRALFFNEAKASIGELVSVTTAGTVSTLTFTEDITANLRLGNNVYKGSTLLGTIFAIGTTSIDIDNMLDTPDPEDDISYEDYIGGEIGSTSGYSSHSHVSAQVEEATANGVIFDYAEVEFLLAEAAARTFAVGGTAKSHYDAGITASILNWGGSAADATTFLAQTNVDYDTTLAASTATMPWKEVIGNQKWLALYNRGLEAWTSIRLLDFPILAEPSQPVSEFPNRYTYPVVEQTLNGANYQSASSAIGGDVAETKLFWDMN